MFEEEKTPLPVPVKELLDEGMDRIEEGEGLTHEEFWRRVELGDDRKPKDVE